MVPSVIASNKQIIVTCMLLGALVGGGHLPPKIDSLLFYATILAVALIGFARNASVT